MEPVAVELGIQSLEEPDLLLSEGKWNEFGTQTREGQPRGRGGFAILAAFDQCQKPAKSRMVQNFRKPDADLKMFLD